MNLRTRESLTLQAFSGCLGLFLSIWLPWFRPVTSLPALAELAREGESGEALGLILASVQGQAPVQSRVLMGIHWPVSIFLLCTVLAGVLVTLRTSGWCRPAAWWISGTFFLGASGVAAWCVRGARAGADWQYGGLVAAVSAALVFTAWFRYHFPSRREKNHSP